MGNAIRKTIDFSPDLYEEIKTYGKARGCRHFSEIIRDIVRIVIKPVSLQEDTKQTQNTEFKQSENVL